MSFSPLEMENQIFKVMDIILSNPAERWPIIAEKAGLTSPSPHFNAKAIPAGNTANKMARKNTFLVFLINIKKLPLINLDILPLTLFC